MINQRLLTGLFALVVAVSVVANQGTALADLRSGHPPTLASAQIDNQHRLVITYSAPDGVTYGGYLFLGSDSKNAQPVSSNPAYGPIMYCNNNSTCQGRWKLAATPDVGPFTFTTEALDAQRFPAGTYYLQVDTTNEDPYASTRQEEFSNIVTVQIPPVSNAGGSASIQQIPLLITVSVPISNGSGLCIARRDHLIIGNRLVLVTNNYYAGLNRQLAKLTTLPPAVDAAYKQILKEKVAISEMLAHDQLRATAACSAAPSVVAENGDFVPIPIPRSNGAAACDTGRTHADYINREITKIVNNLRVTKRSQTVRIHQLEVRFNQLNADLKASWPKLLQACNPL